MRRCLTGLLCLVLVGCGGGGSGGGSNIGVGATVPDVLGQTQAAATTAITGASLTVGTITTAGSLTVPVGDVMSQNPTGGTPVAVGSAVDLVISSGTGGGGGAFFLDEPFPNLPNFDNPVFFTAVPLPDTRLVVIEQTGRIKVFTPSASVSTTSVILDVSSLIISQGEQGLLGFAFDPDFNANNFMYVYYTRSGDGAIVVARYTWNPATAAANSPKIILTVPHSDSSNHNGGMIAFGPDGFLYIALGDGGGADDQFNNGQNLNSLLAKILRIDVHPANPANAYDVPANNPFVNMAPRRPETWAFGLRNPFRFSFDRLTGQLWVGDVGQGAREEIDNATVGGRNFGWPRFEGTLLNRTDVDLVTGTQHTPPIKEYDHSLGFAIIGGYVYRGSMASLDGKYVYCDYGSGTVWAMDTPNGTNNVVLTSAPNPTSFGEDNDGELYLVTQNGWLFRLTDGTVGGP
jgi:glucose/arabinose dehydrogenase